MHADVPTSTVVLGLVELFEHQGVLPAVIMFLASGRSGCGHSLLEV